MNSDDNSFANAFPPDWGMPTNGQAMYCFPPPPVTEFPAGSASGNSDSNSPAPPPPPLPPPPPTSDFMAVGSPFTAPNLMAATGRNGGTEESMPSYDQNGSVILGPGSHKEAMLLGLGLPRLSHRQHDDLAKAKKYAMEQSIKHVLMKQTVAHQQQQQKVAMYAQALSLMARVYVGSISFELREDAIKNAFSPFGPIKSVNMSWDPITGHHKGFAFIEYEVPEAAMLAQEQMNGVLMGGRNIKVGRPSNIPQAQPIIDMISQDAKLYNRIYVASIHPDLTETDVKSVFEAFGPIRVIEFAKGPVAGKHKGYAFIEYDNEKAALDAVASMNLFDLGGQHLRVGRAITPPQAKEYSAPPTNSTLPTAAAVAAAAVTAKIQAMETSVGAPLSGSGISVAPSVVVGNTPPTTALGGSVFSVPPPGVAIPQASAPTPSPSVVMPQLYSFPTPSSTTSASSVSSPALQGGGSPSAFMTGQFQSSPGGAAVYTPSFSQQPMSIPPPSVVTPTMSQLSFPPQPITLSQQQTNATQTPSAVQRLQPAGPAGASVLTDKQKQLLDMEPGQSLAAQEDLKIKGNEARNIRMHKLMRRTGVRGTRLLAIGHSRYIPTVQSCVLALKNMVGPEDVDDSLQDEVAEECSKYGQVEQVIIYQERRDGGDFAPSSVKIFVKYSSAQEADTAKNALDGRYFNGRKIKAEIYDQNLFEHQDLSG